MTRCPSAVTIPARALAAPRFITPLIRPAPNPTIFRFIPILAWVTTGPFGFDQIEPYYEEVEQFLGVSGPSAYPWGPARKQPYALGPLPINGAGQLMERGCKELGIKTSPAANAALSAAYYQEGVGHRPACTNRGFCQAGCNIGAKASMDVTYIPLAIHYGAEIRPECFVTQLPKNASGKSAEVIYIRNGQEERQRCRYVFLCAGTIETARLLLLNDLANSSGQVGRNVMAHPGLQIWGEFDEDVRPYKGIPGALISEDTHRPKDRNGEPVDFAGWLFTSVHRCYAGYVHDPNGAGAWTMGK